MPLMLRFIKDVEVPDGVTGKQVREMSQKMDDALGCVIAPLVIEKDLAETAPEGEVHIHIGSNGRCVSCKNAAEDGKDHTTKSKMKG